MADCSKTEVFLAETDRMCDDCGEYLRDNYCDLCPIEPLCDAGRYNRRKILNGAIEYVQKWSDEHPVPKPKTYADDFVEKFPKCDRDAAYGCVPVVCKAKVYGGDCNNGGRLYSTRIDCEKCWNEPYKEEE